METVYHMERKILPPRFGEKSTPKGRRLAEPPLLVEKSTPR